LSTETQSHEFPPVFFLGRQALVEAVGHRHVVLASGHKGELQTCGPDGLLVPINPEEGWPAQVVLAVNSYGPMHALLTRALDELEGAFGDEKSQSEEEASFLQEIRDVLARRSRR
jgi:hypothetical protein